MRPASCVVLLIELLVVVAWCTASAQAFFSGRPLRHAGALLAVHGRHHRRCILYYFHLRNRALSPALTEARLQALQARIRPHFLFNSINAVLSLIRPEPKRAEAALEDMADLFRVLMADNRDLSTLEREVELTRQYLNLEQLRLGERLQVEWHIDNMPGEALIPPLVLQPLVENAVYHGIEPSLGTRRDRASTSTKRATKSTWCCATRIARTATITPATRWRSATSASGWPCTSTPRRACARRSTDDAYQVHIVMPYRKERR